MGFSISISSRNLTMVRGINRVSSFSNTFAFFSIEFLYLISLHNPEHTAKEIPLTSRIC
ncbi:hypothetical protein Hdeb2414_s0011g00361981 [Helianthus debilis subsp. tardiflorus]